MERPPIEKQMQTEEQAYTLMRMRAHITLPTPIMVRAISISAQEIQQ